jgi:hypothetical protein
MSMNRLCLALALVTVASPALAEEQVIEGRLEEGDQQLSMNEYYDVYPVDATAGDIVRIRVSSPDFLPGGMLIDPAGNQVYYSLGSALDKVWEYEWTVPSSGPWQFVVFQSFWLEGAYTITWTELN